MATALKAVGATEPTGLALLRSPFPPNCISKLPKETRKQIDERKQNVNAMVFNCPVCGGHHHKKADHLDYVGHAALTDRLLDSDPEWSWEPLAVNQHGLPAFDENGGLWIRLTVCGVTRLGYGSADGKSGGDAKKEIIGDALRNAAMRFGAALDLWHKGDLHADEASDEPAAAAVQNHSAPVGADQRITGEQRDILQTLAEQAGVDLVTLCRKCGIASLPYLPADKFDATRRWLAGKLADKQPTGPQYSEELADDIPY